MVEVGTCRHFLKCRVFFRIIQFHETSRGDLLRIERLYERQKKSYYPTLSKGENMTLQRGPCHHVYDDDMVPMLRALF